jgi:SAM-dependent methyltransferase
MKSAVVLLLSLLSTACRPGGHAEHSKPLGHRFERAEDYAARWDDPARDAWQMPAEVVARMQLAPGMTVADIGAGTGYFLKYLSAAVGPGGRVLALDIEPDMIRYLGERAARDGLPNVSPKLVLTDDPGLPEGAVDRVLIVNTWHHIPDRAAYARRLARGLAPGGVVFIVDYTLESEEGPPKRERVSPEAVAEELRAGGLTAEILAEPLPRQYIVVGRLP